MLLNFKYGERVLHTVTPNLIGEENKFTVIVGKNGTGKSRILKAIIETFINPEVIERDRETGSFRFGREPSLNLAYQYLPSSVIGVSTSPFDRFPLPKTGNKLEHYGQTDQTPYSSYEYLGLRGLYSKNLSLSFMSRTITALVEAVYLNPDHAKRISNVLNYLHYDGSIEARFQFPYPIGQIREILARSDGTLALYEYLTYRQNGLRTLPSFGAYSDGTIDAILEALIKVVHVIDRPRIDIVINSDGVFDTINPNHEINESFVTLLNFGMLRLREVSLLKLNSESRFRINEASSGEQSVVLGFLGIASHIEDGSLICIDEPEICLHPEWQERYIQLLISTFRNFKRCHFIIATHSPQIIAKLEDKNCFVLNIETGTTVDAKELIRKSADFQLANTFGTPGYKNEYLTRELLSLLTHFSQTGDFSTEQLDLAKKLLALESMLEQADPVRQLMAMLAQALQEVA